MAQDISIRKSYLLRVDAELWDKFLETVPRDRYASINVALNEMIRERVETTVGDDYASNDSI